MNNMAHTLENTLILEACRTVEAAAIACHPWIGKGDQNAADQAAVDAMRRALNAAPISGTVVIGEGERDEAPMLYIGEEVGTGGLALDIALDPLEGTGITAAGGPGALAVLAFAQQGNFLNAPDVYMDKIAVGGGFQEGVISLNFTPEDNLKRLAVAKRCPVSDLTVCILDRPRHENLIAAVRKTGARIHLIGDGDVAGVIATTNPNSGIDMYMGSGGAPEGVLAAAALRCIGGQIEGRLLFRNEDEKARAAKWGVTDLDRIYHTTDMAAGDVIFAAAGVTDGPLVQGVRVSPNDITTQTLILESANRTVRKIETIRPR